MSLYAFSTQEKLGDIERRIELERRGPIRDPRQLDILKSIAADLRARLDRQPTVALTDLTQRVLRVLRSRTSVGYDKHALHELGQGVAVHWATIKQALELFGEQV